MCFLKAFKPLDQISFDKDSATDESSFQENSKQPQQESYLNKLFTAKTPVLLSKQDQMLQQLMLLVSANNLALRSIEQKLQQNEENLNSSHQSLASVIQEQHSSLFARKTSDQDLQHESSDQLTAPSSTLLTQLFGPKKYAYKLQLQETLPSTIYKERNINISVNLLDHNSEKIMNSNMIHLCLGVCDVNGNWISENKVGQNFMKGKTEVQMYHGDASFLKVYPRDVSRHYAEGKVHFVVYSKPSMIKFSSNSTSMERIVNSNEIEALIISDLIIKAKKN